MHIFTELRQNKKLSFIFLGFAFTIPYAFFAFLAALYSNSLTLWAIFFKIGPASLLSGLSAIVIYHNEKGHLDYDFGLGKFESLFSLLFSIFIGLYSASILYLAIHRMLYPERLNYVVFSFIGYSVFLAIDFCGFIQSKWLYLKQRSIVILAQTVYYKACMGADLIGLLPLGLTFFTRIPFVIPMSIDIMSALLLCVISMVSALKMSHSSVSDLLDSALEERAQLIILKTLAKHFDLYTQYHGQRTRCSSNIKYIDLFLAFEGSQSFKKGMESIERIKKDIESAITGSVVNIVLTDGQEK